MDIEIRDSKNKLIGWCKDRGNQIDAMHYIRGYVGKYSKFSNITFDKTGKIFCYGDGTASLVRLEEDK